MKTRLATQIFPAAFALLAFLAAPHAAAAQIAKVENTGEALVFYSTVETRAVTLTITGPCQFEYEASSKDGKVAFKLSDEAFDGVYSYNLGITPVIDDRIMEILTAARKTGDNGRVRQLCRDGKLPTGPTSQSGDFTVSEGRIVLDPSPEGEGGPSDGRDEQAELEVAPQGAGDAALAARFRAEDDDLSEELLHLASAGSTPAAGECLWARFKTGPDLQGRF